MRGLLNVGVTITAIHTQDAYVETMVKCYWLIWGVADVKVLVGGILIHRSRHERTCQDEEKDDAEWSTI
jgi:hypothetical protein